VTLLNLSFHKFKQQSAMKLHLLS